MAEFILYKPMPGGGWMPFVVRQKSAIPGLLAQGYRQQLPEQPKPKTAPVVAAPEPKPAVVDNASPDGLAINQVTEKELAGAIKGVGLVKARKILKSKPFNTIEDLYKAEPSVDWASVPINYGAD